MYEVEIRARVKDLEGVKSRLLMMGAQDLGSKRVCDTVYGNAGLYSVKLHGFCYRIREKGSKLIVDKKGKAPEAFTWSEEVLDFNSREVANSYLREQGLHPYLVIDRTRHEFKHGDVEIALDDVVNLGKFIEVEKQVEDQSLAEQARGELEKFLYGLGLQEEDREPQPYGWLFTLRCEQDNTFAEQLARQLGVSVDQLFNR